MTITLLDTKPGEKVVKPFDFDPFAFTDGNWTCDCNREIFFGLDTAEHVCLGAKRFLVIACDHPEFDYAEFNQNYPKELVEMYQPS